MKPSAANRFDEARVFVDTGLSQDPDNAYLRYLRAALDQRDAKSKRSPGPSARSSQYPF